MTTHRDLMTRLYVKGPRSHLAGDITLRPEVIRPSMYRTGSLGVLTPSAFKGRKAHNPKWPSLNARPKRNPETRIVLRNLGKRSRRRLWLNSTARKPSVRPTMDLMRTKVHTSSRYLSQRDVQSWNTPQSNLLPYQSSSQFLCVAPRHLPPLQLRLRRYHQKGSFLPSCRPVR